MLDILRSSGNMFFHLVLLNVFSSQTGCPSTHFFPYSLRDILTIPLVSSEGDSCEFGSQKYFVLCGFGGILSCGTTHTAVVPLDLVKCRMQVCLCGSVPFLSVTSHPPITLVCLFYILDKAPICMRRERQPSCGEVVINSHDSNVLE